MGNSSSDMCAQVAQQVCHTFWLTVLKPFMEILAKKQPEDSNKTMQEIEQALAESGKREREAQLEREAVCKEREEAALAEAEKANNALQQGIRPIVMPTKEQFQAAQERIQYSSEKLHFAVCGTSGSGKSSLINAFRGLGSREGGAAAVGVTETTSEVTRYPDPRSKIPYLRFVWYDIPGAGTTNVPDWQYFNDQGLFVFDFIIMVYDVRFTTIDVGIIENCLRFNIPVFIVRSKADQHVDNLMKEEGIDLPPADDDYQRIRREYIEATKSDFDQHMLTMSENPKANARDRHLILNQRVYIVSAGNVRGLLQSGVRKWRVRVDRSKLIDEELLVEDMLRAAAMRRYSEAKEKGLSKKGE